ncbi:L-threonylcarbamoyladenylate synthase [Malassezia equina]|uniref:Threonylcarbamoyl-AMP synthase n=1 Tax=Malassezia equina TaxID=1381935 RepID=A0AAF0J004_9BASI|nr:L-threonylcarbamoyladenylate synthase [Malassezia equina]
MPQIHTQILPVPHVSSSLQPRDFGLQFCDESQRQGTMKEPLERLQVSFLTEKSKRSLETAADHLRSGELVAFPTETVYGLGAYALRSDASERIYAAKNRPADNPLIVHISDTTMLQQILPDAFKINEACKALMQAFWPGPLTLLFPVGQASDGSPTVPSTVTCGQPTVGVRMPSHPVARALISLAGVPIAAPSANASGRPSPTTAAHVMNDLGPRNVLSYIVDGGECHVGVESTVVDATTVSGEVRVLRPGGITVEQLSKVLRPFPSVLLRVYGKDLARSAVQEAAPTTPGMKYRHYSPDARVLLVSDGVSSDPTLLHVITNTASSLDCQRDARVGLMLALDSPLLQSLGIPEIHQWALSQPSERLSPVVRLPGLQLCLYSLGQRSAPDMAARRLFDGLRTLDACVAWSGQEGACDLIVAEEVDETGMGLAIMNRLRKAASSTIRVAVP